MRIKLSDQNYIAEQNVGDGVCDSFALDTQGFNPVCEDLVECQKVVPIFETKKCGMLFSFSCT